MSTATTLAVTAVVAGSAAPKSGGAALWFILMLVLLIPFVILLTRETTTTEQAKSATGGICAIGFILFVVIIGVSASNDPEACSIVCRQEKREAEVRRIKAENVANGKACYTHLDTMVPCPGAPKP